MGCVLSVDTASSSPEWIIRGHDPFSSNEPVARFEVIFRNEGTQDCSFRPQFVLDGETFGLSNGNARTLAYSLTETSTNVNLTPISGRSVRRVQRRPIIVEPRGQKLVSFLLTVPDPRISGDGLYFQNVNLEAEGSDGTLLGGQRLVLGLDVLPSALMSLSGAFRRNDGQANIDLGPLKDGRVAIPLNLHVRSTRGYQVTFDSKNQGRLRLGSTEWTVNYDLLVGGKILQLSSAQTYSAARPKSAFDSLPMEFQISGASNKRAGVYSDTLTIAVAAY
ncbi:MAG: hypothetical protein Pars93KO_26350 [Parasphingorhabdus sp.]